MNNEQTKTAASPNQSTATPVHQKRHRIANAHFFLILWGIILFVFYLTHYFEKTFPALEGIQNFLIVLFPVGVVISILFSKKIDKSDSHNNRLYIYSWGGAALSMIFWLLNNDIYESNLYLAVTIMLFGLASFITGGVAKFTPAIAGGLLSIALSAIIPSLDLPMQYLVSAVAIFSCSLVPGITILYQIKSDRKTKKNTI